MFAFIGLVALFIVMCIVFPRAMNMFFILFGIPSLGMMCGAFFWALAAIVVPSLVAWWPFATFVIAGIVLAEIWYFKTK